MDKNKKTALPYYWSSLKRSAQLNAIDRNFRIEDLVCQGENLFNEYRRYGYIRGVFKKSLQIHIYAYIYFYKKLSEINSNESPIIHRENANWMLENDFCSINIRALNPDHEKTGSFLDGIKLLPFIRPSNIHLLPFFDCHVGSLYAVDSFSLIADECIDLDLLAQGLSRNNQLKIFIDAAHILNKTVGFDLVPHTQQFSRVVIDNPEYFRWIRISEDKQRLFESMNQKQMLSIEEQEKIIKDVKLLVRAVLNKYNMEKVEDFRFSVEQIRRVHREILQLLINKGFWTIPSHTWAGLGVPIFNGYCLDRNYAKFLYINKYGEDHEDHAFGNLTPFRFYDNLNICKDPEEDNLPTENAKTIEYFANIFPEISKKYGFDFLRMDYMDHVFDATFNETHNIAASDRLIPSVIRKMIDHIKNEKPYIGVLAEGMGTSFESYKDVMNIDLLVGHNLTSNTNRGIMESNFQVARRMQTYNSSHKQKAGVLYTIDSHDSGHQLFWGEPISVSVGFKGMALRMFVSKFSSCGAGKRPRLECIGNQDLSYGLFVSNNSQKSLHWKADNKFNELYHNIYDIYEEFKDLMTNSSLTDEYLDNEIAYWFINGDRGKQERLLAICFIERHTFNAGEKFNQETTYQAREEVYIDYRINYHFDNPIVEEINLYTKNRTRIPDIDNYLIKIHKIEPFEFKLFYIHSQNM